MSCFGFIIFEHAHMYLSVALLSRNMKPYVNSLVNSVDPDQLASEEAS